MITNDLHSLSFPFSPLWKLKVCCGEVRVKAAVQRKSVLSGHPLRLSGQFFNKTPKLIPFFTVNVTLLKVSQKISPVNSFHSQLRRVSRIIS